MSLRTAPRADRHDLLIGTPTAADDVVRIRLTGVLDGINADQLVDACTAVLGDPAAGCVELHVAGLAFLDSGGIRALLRCRKAAEHANRQLRLVDPSPPVRQVLTITGLLGFLRVTD